MKTICIIGAGNIGSRHLQGIKKVNFPLSIEVIDPSENSLKISEERYKQIPSTTNHKISFMQNLSMVSKKIDLAIIATTSSVRRIVSEQLLSNSSVKYLILEKILFQKRRDYSEVEKLLKSKNCKAWVNFSMRTMPFYYGLKNYFRNEKIQLVVSGSQYGLITNTIHFVDYMAFLTNNYNFTIDTTLLDPRPILSKRSGFLELNGTLNVRLKEGSFGSFTCYPKGNTPFMVEVLSEDFRCISNESIKKAWLAKANNKWRWTETDTQLPYQSEMTNLVVEKILRYGSSVLTPYPEAAKLHLQLLDGLLNFLNRSRKKYTVYPFT